MKTINWVTVSLVGIIAMGCNLKEKRLEAETDAAETCPAGGFALTGHSVDSLLASTRELFLADGSRREAWALLAVTEGCLVSGSQEYTVFTGEAANAGELVFKEFRRQPATYPLGAAELEPFNIATVGADRLSDLSLESVGGTTFYYVHATRKPEGEITRVAKFTSKNPQNHAIGQAHADVVKAFRDLHAAVGKR